MYRGYPTSGYNQSNALPLILAASRRRMIHAIRSGTNLCEEDPNALLDSADAHKLRCELFTEMEALHRQRPSTYRDVHARDVESPLVFNGEE